MIRGYWVIALTCWSLFAAATVQSKERLGISLVKPSQPPFVKVDEGYMVPYRTTIPGTDVSFEMVPVPGGVVRLRIGPEAGASETGALNTGSASGAAAVTVTVEPLWLGRHEVTWAEYNRYTDLLKTFTQFERLGIRKVTSENVIDAVTAPSTLYDPMSRFPASAPMQEWRKHPAVSMTQYGAKQYTKWLSKLSGDFYRLPSEAEWEYACRAGSTTAYSYGDDAKKLTEYAWCLDNSADDTHPVGLKKPNRWGLFDMHGNASEWVLDETGSNYEPLRKAVVAGEPPIYWPTRLHPRTVRGGSWESKASDCRSASRLGSSVEWHDEEPQVPPSPHWLTSAVQRQVGFRIARPLNPPPALSRGKYWDADVDQLKEAVADYLKWRHAYPGIVDPQLPAAIENLKK